MQQDAAGDSQEVAGDQPGNQPGGRYPNRWLAEHAFKPGQSGNPKGRPAGIKTLVARLHDTLARDEQLATGVVDALIAVAATPSHPAWSAAQRLLWERHDGALQEALAQRTVPDIVLLAAGVRETRAERVVSPKAPQQAASNEVLVEPHPAVAPHTNDTGPKSSQQSSRRFEV